jgi:SNF2 family DNA or RNA helicase
MLDLLTGGVGSDDDRATLSEEQLQIEEDNQIAAATAATMGRTSGANAKEQFSKEHKLLDAMTEVAEAARGKADARVKKLFDWIREQMCPELPKPSSRPAKLAPWNDTRILIFTEYDDTKRYLVQQLSAVVDATEQGEQRIAVFHGPTPPDEREAIKLAFNASPSKHPLRILVATDAAREGLNLQAHCQHLFHFDVPWNPSRMEQRNGRIDRKLQPKPEVFCHYFFYHQRPEDRVISALVRKSERIKEELGSMNTVLDSRLIKTMQRGIKRDQIETMEREILDTDLDPAHRQTIDEELEVSRDRQEQLRGQIERLRTLLDDSRRSIGLDEEHFQSAISCALELLGSEPLKALAHAADDGKPPRSAFPALDQREGADSSWADTQARSEAVGLAARGSDSSGCLRGLRRNRR